ncbi:MAG TPA: hypothetical protein VHB18_02450 [Mycobacteriales bacterium]|jgi:hypothetical protein|nr:hypothetical protein [Mycobacteriales bacterium]
MHNFDDAEFGTRLFPGVDLTLWLQLVLLVLVVAAGAIALAVF